jgi:hypothetical protein
VGINGLGDLDAQAFEPNLHMPSCRRERLVSEHDRPVDQVSVDLVQPAIEAHEPILSDFALGFEEKDVVDVSLGRSDIVREPGPSIQRRFVEGGMRCLMILAFDPRPEPAIERLEGAEIIVAEPDKEPAAYCPKEPLDLSLGLRVMGARVHQRDAELRHDDAELVTPKRAPVVDE